MPTDPPEKIPFPGNDPDQEDLDEDLDLAVAQSIVRLTGGHVQDLKDLDWPPDEIYDWIRQTSVREVNGLLLAALERWHQLHGPNSSKTN